jgi:hypothetical protein
MPHTPNHAEGRAALYPLFSRLGHNLMIAAVLDGNSRGRVYSDSAEKPEAAFVCTTAGYFLAGRPDSESYNARLAKAIPCIRAGDTVWPGEPASDPASTVGCSRLAGTVAPITSPRAGSQKPWDSRSVTSTRACSSAVARRQ